MVGMILTGHGHFAEGMLSALDMVMGKQENIKAVDFFAGESIEDFRRQLKEAAVDLGGTELVFLTDIAGGSPFNQSVLLQRELPQEIRVFSGTNLPFLLTAAKDREGPMAELSKRWLAEDIQVAACGRGKKRAVEIREEKL